MSDPSTWKIRSQRVLNRLSTIREKIARLVRHLGSYDGGADLVVIALTVSLMFAMSVIIFASPRGVEKIRAEENDCFDESASIVEESAKSLVDDDTSRLYLEVLDMLQEARQKDDSPKGRTYCLQAKTLAIDAKQALYVEQFTANKEEE